MVGQARHHTIMRMMVAIVIMVCVTQTAMVKERHPTRRRCMDVMPLELQALGTITDVSEEFVNP